MSEIELVANRRFIRGRFEWYVKLKKYCKLRWISEKKALQIISPRTRYVLEIQKCSAIFKDASQRIYMYVKYKGFQREKTPILTCIENGILKKRMEYYMKKDTAIFGLSFQSEIEERISKLRKLAKRRRS